MDEKQNRVGKARKVPLYGGAGPGTRHETILSRLTRAFFFQCRGVELRNGVIVGLSLPDYNLTGTLPSASLARLESLTSLWLQDNDLQGALPPDIGGYGSLPNLKILSVENNEHLGGVISRDFLNTCEECNISGCAPQWAPEPMKTPFLCGASFCSEDIGDIFCHGPKKATERLQAKTATHKEPSRPHPTILPHQAWSALHRQLGHKRQQH